jgi:hypothetical protein
MLIPERRHTAVQYLRAFPCRRYRGAALMAKDSDALAYQAAAFSDTVRCASLRRADFLALWRLTVLVLLTLAPLAVSRAFPTGFSDPLFSHRQWQLVKAPGAGLVNVI